MVNFTACSAQFLDNLDLYKNYTYNGPVSGIFQSGTGRPPMLSLEGCWDLCGRGSDYYPWGQASSTALTWILPMLALLTKAPFESNQTKRTFLVLIRWFGSPIASLSYIFWNIKVTGRCALMADMATAYDEVPLKDSEYSDIRDSIYILTIMNQYNIRAGVPSVEGEKLLRIALFSDTLKLAVDEDQKESLPMIRKRIAYRLRAGRKRGPVPIFFSALWWIFALGVTLEAAFGNIGENATAHDLALGLMIGWFPVLVLACVVDRTPFATPEVRLRLNALLDQVRAALLNDSLRNTYMRQEGRTADDFAWTDILKRENFMGTTGFFTGFAGQGRGRFHYGVAHPVITGIEEAYVAGKGRGWLGTTQAEMWQARTALVMGPQHGDGLEGLRYFDMREFWEVLAALSIVAGTIVGAFIISYYTPTVGLGCRSGGYMVFFVIAFSAAFFEGVAWWLLPEGVAPALRPDIAENSDRRYAHYLHRAQLAYRYDPRSLVEKAILRPMEFINTTWLWYIMLAQTVGSYNTCECKASNWGGKGGYMNFASAAYYKDHGITIYWASGVGLSLYFMLGAIAYIITEWCTQSHLTTENYDAASRGLRRTRTFKKYTLPFRIPIDLMVSCVRVLWNSRCGVRRGVRGRRSLVWSWRTHTEHLNASDFEEHGVVYSKESEMSTSGDDAEKKEQPVVTSQSMSSVEVSDEIRRPKTLLSSESWE